MKPVHFALFSIITFSATSRSDAQTSYFWRSEAADGTWSNADNWWDGVQMATPAGTEILVFDNDVQPTMTNDLPVTARHQIRFNFGAVASRTIGGTAVNQFVASGFTGPAIRNESGSLHSMNFPILLDPDNLAVETTSGSIGLGGIISGTGGILKTGADTLFLSAANTFSGKSIVDGGTLSIDGDNRLGAAPGSPVADQLTLNGGSLRTTGGSSVSIHANRGITLGAAGGTLDSSAQTNGLNANFNSPITGTGALTLKANGDTSDSGGGVGGNLSLLNSSNNFIGNITVQSGVVNFSDDGAFGNTANDIVIQGGGLVATGNRTLPSTRDIALSGGGNKIFRAYGSATFTVNGAISGNGNVRHTDGGNLVLNGTNSFTGNIDNVRGTLTLANSAHTGNIVNTAGTLTLANAAHTGNVTNSAGTLVLNAGNTYTGYTHIQGSSTLRLDADNALPDGSTVLLYGGTTFNANSRTDTLGSLTTGSASDSNVIVNLGSGGNLTITNNNLPPGLTGGYSNATVAGRITGTGNITYNHATSNTALWDWQNGTNDFTGEVTITNGRLRTALNGGIGAFGATTNDLIFNGEVAPTLTNGLGTASIQGTASGAINLGVDRSIILNSGKEGTLYVWGGNTYTIEGQITGGGNLRKEDAGILLLNNISNNYTGLTRIALGTIRVGVSGVIPDASGIEIAGGNLDLNALTESVASLSGTGGAVNGGGTLTVLTSGSATYSGNLQNATTLNMAGTGTQTIAGTSDNANGWASVSSGTLELAKSSSATVHALGRSYAVGLTVSGGTARLGGTGNDQIYFQTNVTQSGGVFDFNGRNEAFRGLTGTGGTIHNSTPSTTGTLTLGEATVAIDSFTYGGVIANGAGTMALTKTGPGTQVLTGNHPFNGPTHIDEGDLRINGSFAGDVLIAAQGTLSGIGSITGAVTSSGTIAPGESVGTMTVASCDLDGTLAIQIDGSSADRLNVTGAFDIGSAHLVATPLVGGATEPVYIIASYGSLTGTEFLSQTLPSGYSVDLNYQDNKQIALVPATDPFELWADAKSLPVGLDGPNDDADGDGLSNRIEFAFDNEPLSAATSPKISAGLRAIDGGNVLALTLPIRNGAVFDGTTELVSDPVDGLTYHIQGSEILADWDVVITEISGTEVTAIHQSLPQPSTGWSYRTFKTAGGPATDPRQFIRAAVE